MNLWKLFLGILYPKTCCFCGKISEKELCDICAKKVVYIKEPRCKKCGRPVRYQEQEFCGECRKKAFSYEQGRSIWLHKEPVSTSLYRFKYHNRRIYGEFYAKELYRLYGKKIKEWKIDVIIPVPLHKKRRRVRGYNQAEIIAKELGKLAVVSVDTKSVFRKKYTAPQKELNDKQRKQNLKDAFAIQKNAKLGRNILLVDDIYTTGSTIDTIAQLLLKNGAGKVCFFTISIGQDF